ncbi:MAG: DUF1801 domain-containing protein [Gammaproteobacteria bacterium]|nr:DUF1801 domain-containing protein [Gammaproteobacteria bacterium]
MMRALFRLEQSMANNPAVNRWFDGHRGPLGDLALHWFEVIRRSGDNVEELLHDGQPTACVSGAAFAYVAVYASHVNVGFFQGSELPDPQGLLTGTGKYNGSSYETCLHT